MRDLQRHGANGHSSSLRVQLHLSGSSTCPACPAMAKAAVGMLVSATTSSDQQQRTSLVRQTALAKSNHLGT